MQMNWSIILNVVLLMGVIFAIMRVLRSRKKLAYAEMNSSSLRPQLATEPTQSDDIIAVRKLNVESPSFYAADEAEPAPFVESVAPASDEPVEAMSSAYQEEESVSMTMDTPPVMMFLLAKANRQLAGYELLQAVLSAGLRFGEGNLFHRHQYANGQGPILCSLAAATDEGVFDLQNIGAFTVRGLCLYMHPSGNPGIDSERFDIMLDTAKTLSEDLDTYLLDERRKPLSDASIQRYHQRLNLIEEAVSV